MENYRFTIRVYDNETLEAIDRVYSKCKSIYPTLNPFLVECIKRGVDSIEKDVFGKKDLTSMSELYEEIHKTVEKLTYLINQGEINSKEIMSNLLVNQRISSCNYGMLIGLSENKPVPKRVAESGVLDDLPERLESILEELLNIKAKK